MLLIKKIIPDFSGTPFRLLLLTFVIAYPMAVNAYVGPGAGLTMLGSLWGLIIAVLFIVFGILLLPVKLMLNRMRKNKQAENAANKVVDPDEPQTKVSPDEKTKEG